MSTITTTRRTARITFQSPFVLMEAFGHLQGIWEEVVRVAHPFGPQWGLGGFPKTFELEDTSVTPTDDNEGLHSRAYFFWTGGNAGRIEVAGHTSHYGTHWDGIRSVTLWWKSEGAPSYEGKVRWDLSPTAIGALGLTAYYRARTGEGCDYPVASSPLGESETKAQAIVNAELGVVQLGHHGLEENLKEEAIRFSDEAYKRLNGQATVDFFWSWFCHPLVAYIHLCKEGMFDRVSGIAPILAEFGEEAVKNAAATTWNRWASKGWKVSRVEDKCVAVCPKGTSDANLGIVVG